MSAMLKKCLGFSVAALIFFGGAVEVARAGEVRSFTVINLRSATLTAQYWNPILDYLSRKSGVSLQLTIGRSQPETVAAINRGEVDYVVSGTIFSPRSQLLGYRVIGRLAGPPVHGQIVVAQGSKLKTLNDIEGAEVGFSSRSVFIAYAVPMNEIVRRGLHVKANFAGNQEGVMGQLLSGRIEVAAVHSQVMHEFSEREGFAYRVLWSSEKYQSWPLSAHPRLPDAEVKAVQAAVLAMKDDPVGREILIRSAAIIKQQPPFGFMPASDRDYENYRRFYKTTQVRDCDGCSPQ